MFSCNDLELIQVIIYLSKESFAGSRCNSFSVPLPFLQKLGDGFKYFLFSPGKMNPF